MPEVLGDPPSPRTALFWNGAAWQWALVDAAGHLQLDVLSTVMDADAATETTLSLVNDSLSLLAVLWNCLRTVGTDRFMVKGEDQLFSYNGALHETRIADISGANGYVDSHSCPAGTIWVVTGICVADTDSPITAVSMEVRSGGNNYAFHFETVAVPAWTWYPLQTEKYLDPTDLIRITLAGSVANDSCRVILTGYTMTLET